MCGSGPSRRRVAALSIALATAGLLPSDGRTAEDLRYDQAMTEMSAGRTQAAIGHLRAIVASEPAHQGARLDLAIAYCLAGQPEAAGQIFDAFEQQPDLPPAIAEVIAFYRAGGCRPAPARLRGFAALGVGYARNLNLAPLSGLISLPGLGTEIPLSDASRPRHAWLGSWESGALYALTRDESWTLGGYAQGHHYQGATQYSIDSAIASLNYRRTFTDLRTEAQLAHARLWLGGRSHLSATVANASATLPIGRTWLAGPVLSGTQLAFSELSAFDSRQVELRGRLQWQAPGLRATFEAGWQQDSPMGGRPGGERRGTITQIQAHWLATPNDSLSLLLRQARLADSQAYNDTLFGDLRRTTRTESAQLGWRHELTSQLTARLEFRHLTSKEQTGLFTYSTQMLMTALEWGFSR